MNLKPGAVKHPDSYFHCIRKEIKALGHSRDVSTAHQWKNWDSSACLLTQRLGCSGKTWLSLGQAESWEPKGGARNQPGSWGPHSGRGHVLQESEME